MAREDDPEVQRNGFEVIIEDVLGVQQKAFKDYFDNHFDPTDTWDENLERFFDYVEKINDRLDSGLSREELEEKVS